MYELWEYSCFRNVIVTVNALNLTFSTYLPRRLRSFETLYMMCLMVIFFKTVGNYNGYWLYYHPSQLILVAPWRWRGRLHTGYSRENKRNWHHRLTYNQDWKLYIGGFTTTIMTSQCTSRRWLTICSLLLSFTSFRSYLSGSVFDWPMLLICRCLVTCSLSILVTSYLSHLDISCIF